MFGCYKSTFGYSFSIGLGIFSWSTEKQDIESSTEAEYVATTSVANQGIWLRKILFELDLLPKEPTVIYVDNKSAIAMMENSVQQGRTKHTNIRFHALRDAEKNGEVKLLHCSSEEQQANILTKALSKNKFDFQRMLQGVSRKNLNEC